VLTRGNRTFICSVAFIDIVEYSRKPVAEQIRLRERLNGLLGEALKDVAANDRIILDTGDGAAISFVGDPEDALFVCLALRDAVSAPPFGGEPPLTMRIGINLGPVKLIQDFNGQPNIIGDGINVAQRVMSFTEPNQILVSRSYYEVVSCLSDAYAKLFRHQGSRTDKHVREHEVYAVGASTDEIKRRPGSGSTTATGIIPLPAAAQTVINHLAHSAEQVTEKLRARPRLGTAVAVVAILVTAVALRGVREEPAPRPIARELPAAPVAVQPPPAAPEKVAEAPPPPKRAPAAPAKPAAKEKPPAAASTPEKVVAAPEAARRPAEPRAAAPVAETGTVAFAITPWGEVFVNGKREGVSPPLREVQLPPGRHKIEVRNTSFPAHFEAVEVKPGERIRIRHKFQ